MIPLNIFFHENEMSWAQAAEYAVSLGGHLVTFSSLEENVTVFDAFESVADPMNGCVHWVVPGLKFIRIL